MALTELQLPEKVRFYNDFQRIADEMYRNLTSWQTAADFIQDVGTVDLDAMGVPAGQLRTDMVDFRQAIDEIVSLFNGNAVTPVKNPKEVIDKIRRMMPI